MVKDLKMGRFSWIICVSHFAGNTLEEAQAISNSMEKDQDQTLGLLNVTK